MALYNKYFYHSHMRDYITAFGALFTDIQVVRANALGEEISRENVPLTFSKKNKYVTRLVQDAALGAKSAIKLPRLAFEYTDITYAPERKITSKRRISGVDPNNGNALNNVYNPVPYDIAFSLSIFSKSQEEALQIIEQIVPFFSPDYTIKVKGVSNPDINYDVPIDLIGVTPDDSYEGAFEDRRVIIWQMDFVMKAFMFGPARNTGIIKTAITEFKSPIGTPYATVTVEPYIEGMALSDITKDDAFTYLTDIQEYLIKDALPADFGVTQAPIYTIVRPRTTTIGGIDVSAAPVYTIIKPNDKGVEVTAAPVYAIIILAGPFDLNSPVPANPSFDLTVEV